MTAEPTDETLLRHARTVDRLAAVIAQAVAS